MLLGVEGSKEAKFISSESEADKLKEILIHTARLIDTLKSSLNSTTVKTANDTASLSELIFQMEQMEKDKSNKRSESYSKLALNEATKEMFDRVLSSLDPVTAERYLDHSIQRQGVERKAALYDAMCEKYEQLISYHENGRLISDYERLYRGKLKRSM